MTLYELTAEMQSLYELMQEDDDDAARDTLEAISLEMDDKAEAYGKIYRSLTAEAEMIRAEEKRLAERRRKIESRADALKMALYKSMVATDRKKIDTPLFSFRIQKNGGKAGLNRGWEDPAELPEAYQKIEVKADEDKIRAALDAGEDLWFASYQPRGETLRISGGKG